MTQILGNVDLITKQEAEAMLNAVVVTEGKIDSKITDAKDELNGNIATEKNSLEASISQVSTSLTVEAQTRAAEDTALGTRIDNERDLRVEADATLTTEITRVKSFGASPVPVKAPDAEVLELVTYG